MKSLKKFNRKQSYVKEKVKLQQKFIADKITNCVYTFNLYKKQTTVMYSNNRIDIYSSAVTKSKIAGGDEYFEPKYTMPNHERKTANLIIIG